MISIMMTRNSILARAQIIFVGLAALRLISTPADLRAQAATFASLAGPSGLGVQRFDIERGHSAVEFSVRFMGLSTVRGAFTDYHGTIMYDPADITKSSVSVVIKARGINSNNENRDRDLKSANFFDVEKYPLILFRSERIVRSKSGFVAHGPLSMHGVTKPVAIEFVQTHGLLSDAWGNKRIGFVGQLSLNRKDYGILGTKFWNSEFDPGRMSVADSVKIDLNIEAEVNQVERWTLPRVDSILTQASARGIRPVLAEFRTVVADTASAGSKNRDDILHGVAVKLMHRGKYQDAAEAYNLAIELSAEPSWAYSGRGEASLMLGKKAAAGDSFRKALANDSTNTVASEYLRHMR
jgi:polyisoprenoid-binding protein YceI